MFTKKQINYVHMYLVTGYRKCVVTKVQCKPAAHVEERAEQTSSRGVCSAVFSPCAGNFWCKIGLARP